MVWIITRKTKKMRKARMEKKKTALKNIERNIETFFILCRQIFFPVTLARKKSAATSSVILPHYNIAYSKEK